MADIILVQPWLGEMDFLRTDPNPPLNLLHAATLVDKKYKIKIIDQRIDKDWRRTLSNELAKPVLCVGLTAYTGGMIRNALEVSQLVKDKSKVPVVWGGIHASLLPKQTVENEYVDIVVQGEGEITFLELAEALEKNKSLSEVKGIWFKDNNQTYSNPPRSPCDLDLLPEIPYHLVEVGRYMPFYRDKRSFNLQTSRGCIYPCSYCYNMAYHKSTWRCLSAEKTLERIKHIVNKLGVRSIYIIDDNFFVDLARAKKIAEGIIKDKLNIEWQLQGVAFPEIKKMDDDYLALFEKSGCIRFSCGIESGSPRIRKLINKGSSLASIKQINRRLSKYKIVVLYTFMTGFPTETVKDLKQTICILFQMLRENRMARNSPIYSFTPYPQTPLAKIVENNGYKLPQELAEWGNYDFVNIGHESITYISADLRRIIKYNFLYYLSFFLDNKLIEYRTAWIIKILVLIYKPIARFRVRHLFFGFRIEKKLIDYFIKLKK